MQGFLCLTLYGLNESPSQKEGKYLLPALILIGLWLASMKVPPKRKGNYPVSTAPSARLQASMKVPPKRKGNLATWWVGVLIVGLNESPSQKEGK